ncbi:Tkl protein kinase [Globisporangium polare]
MHLVSYVLLLLLSLLLGQPTDALSTSASLARAGGGAGGGTGGGTGGGGTSAPTATTSTTSDAPATTSPASTPSTQDRGLGWFNLLKLLDDGEVELRSLRGGPNWDAFCDGAPVLVTKSLSVAENDVCFESWTNLSCTCLSDLKSPSSVWGFQVAKRDVNTTLTAPIPGTAAATNGSAIQVSTIGAFTVPPELTALTLVGESATPLDIRWDFKLLYGQLDVPVLVTSRDLNSSLLTSVEVANLSLSGVDITTDFLPAKLVNISLQNCGIKALDDDFLVKHLPSLQRLVLATNSLTKFESAASLSVASALLELDLSNNQFTSIPASIFQLSNLKKLYVNGNPITNFSITDSQFTQVSKLTAFQLDAVDTASVECTGGEWKSVGAANLCVVPDPTTTTTSSNSSTLYLVLGIAACLLVLVIVFVVLWKRNALFGTKKNSSSSISLLESTGSQDYSLATVDDALLNDPLILMNRIPFQEIVVKECVNRGGFGVVYSGQFRTRKVAIKKIRSEFKADTMRVEAFLREICLMASLDHPRIVEFIGVAWDSLHNLAAVTEFMDQGDLRDVLQSHKKSNSRILTWDAHKTRIALHIVEALAYLHSLVPTVIHRDLKSKNVLLDADLNAKLSDFGISREWTVDDTHMTVGIGTSFWIAPEVLLGKKYDERADIFSFGVVLNEIDTDDYPYWNAANGANGADLNENAILRLVAIGQVQPEFTAECPKAILELANLCLQSDPQNRPTSVQVVNVLRHLLAHGSSASYPSSSSSSSPTSLTRAFSVDSFY